jgi:hypothetical protein
MKIGSVENYNNNILIATDNMTFGVNSINNKAEISNNVPDNVPVLKDYSVPVLKEDSVPDLKENSVPDLKENSVPDLKTIKKFHETNYILPLTIGLSIGLIVYFVK